MIEPDSISYSATIAVQALCVDGWYRYFKKKGADVLYLTLGIVLRCVSCSACAYIYSKTIPKDEVESWL